MHEAARTKTRAGVRVVDIDRATVAVLRRWAKAQKARRLAWGPPYTDSGYVFTAEDGRPLHADNAANRFARLVKAAGVPRSAFTIYGTRTPRCCCPAARRCSTCRDASVTRPRP
jgi:integrase